MFPFQVGEPLLSYFYKAYNFSDRFIIFYEEINYLYFSIIWFSISP